MIEPSPDETQTLIEYARRKYAEERWPLADGLPVREALAALPASTAGTAARQQQYVPSLAAQRR